MKRFLLFAFLLCRPLVALQESYSPVRNVRALGMGNAHYSLSDDEYALFYNPAGLALYHGRPRLTLMNLGAMMTASAADGLGPVLNGASGRSDVYGVVNQIASSQNSPISVAGGFFPYFLTKRFALGLLIGDTKFNAALYGVGPTSTFDVTTVIDNGIFLAWSRKFRRHWHVGTSIKALYRAGGHNAYDTTDIVGKTNFTLSKFQDGGTGFTVDANLGAIYEITDPWIGDDAGISLTLSNPLATYLFSSGNAPPSLLRTFSAGIYTVIAGRRLAQSYTLRVDAADFALGGQTSRNLGSAGNNVFKHLNAGLDVKLSETMYVRGGLHQGNWTAGLGFYLPGFRLDLATYGEELLDTPGALTSRRFALQISLGFELQGSRALFLRPE